MQQLYGLQVDFTYLHGHYMVVSDADGLKADALSGFQLSMLTMNRIPRLLDMQVEEKDGELKLYYNVTGKRMLTQRLRTEKLTLQRFYSLFLEIACVLDDSKIYMLQPGRYVLKEDYIYCGESLDDLYFTYIPKEQLDNKCSVSTDLQHLASRCIHRVDELRGNGFQELMSYLQEENFNIPELKQLLMKHLRLLGQGQEHSAAYGIGTGEGRDMSKSDSRFIKQDAFLESVPESGTQSVLIEPDEFPGISSAATASSERREGSDGGKPEAEKRVKRNKTVIVLSALLSSGVLWKWYIEEPGSVTLYLCLGLNMALLAFAWLLLRRAAPPDTHKDPAEKAMEDWLSGVDAQPHSGGEADFFEEIGLKSGPSAPIPDKEETRGIDGTNAMPTTLLRPNDATVFLGGSAMNNRDPDPSLEFMHDGRRQRTAISKSHFIIGRGAGEADLIVGEQGVSRVHAELVKEEKECVIRDLGSRNGTFVNGELLVPYRMQPLREGDIVKIITTEYTFRMGS
ncbi:DUF6382 domain-containing protein [Paenibacillus filicis]|uniref:DUF6382 domain-containing protein n=1 Tax=Paenibacillus gyeongsangnamensis TaxID=3388067 RepID=A0ABT4QGE0_9BACL|nr:DUF6382 domain-containing protein [Paenibacillus filicis]MCZ8515878.1 DUF6382 domain-containing protein [Paenibacillus filicis]